MLDQSSVESVNFLKVSDLVLSQAVTSELQIVDQVEDFVVEPSDKAELGEDISERLTNAVIGFSIYDSLNVPVFLETLGLDEHKEDRVRTLLRKTGFFVDADTAGFMKYSSPNLQKIFQSLRDQNYDVSQIDYLYKDFSADAQKLWNIPGQSAMIGPIDPEDYKGLFRLYVMERWNAFIDMVEDTRSKSMEKLIKSWSTKPEEFDKDLLDKMYGIYGSKNGDPQEIGELQGGCFIYFREDPVNALESNLGLIESVEKISGANFDPTRMVEISWFKHPYAQEKHIASGVRQILVRENWPTEHEKEILNKQLVETRSIDRTESRIFSAYIDPENEKSKNVARAIGMEKAGEIDFVEEGVTYHEELWILNRNLLDKKIIFDAARVKG